MWTGDRPHPDKLICEHAEIRGFRSGTLLPIPAGVDWPEQAVERIPAREFEPPFCPHPECPAHQPEGREYRYYRHASYFRKSDGRFVPRFRCLDCGGTCSQATFSTTYFLKRPELLPQIAAGLQAGSAHRQLARSLGCAPTTVMRQAARLGRHAILLLAFALDQFDSIEESVVYDDLETFAYSQEQAMGIGTAVGSESWFGYGLECAPHRRGGRRSPAQQAKLAKKPKTFPPGAYRKAFCNTVDLLVEKLPPGGTLDVITDGHPEYREGHRTHPKRHLVRHRVYPNPHRPHKGAPRSHEAIRRDQAMFPADLQHGLMRHTLANHGRETIAFGRRHNAVMERAFLMVVWRNFIKGRSERKPDRRTPAMLVGLTDEPWGWQRLLARRLFPSRQALPPGWRTFYRRDLVTPEVGRNQRHRAVYAA